MTIITASDGMVLTDGSVYGRVLFLAEGKCAEDFTEITEEDYLHIMEESADDTIC